MKKGVLFIATLSIIIGVCCLVIGTILYVPIYQNKDNYIINTVKLNDENKKIDISVDYATVNFYSTTEESHIDMEISPYTNLKQDGNVLKFTNKGFFMLSWLNVFNKNVINVYVNDTKTHDLVFELNAGTLKFNEEIKFENANIELNAGDINIDNLTITNKLEMDVNAGSVNINDITSNSLYIDVSAGKIDAKAIKATKSEIKISAGSMVAKNVDIANTKADVSAGSMTLTMNKKEVEYTIFVDKSAGSCNKTSGGFGSNVLDIDVSAGSVYLYFAE